MVHDTLSPANMEMAQIPTHRVTNLVIPEIRELIATNQTAEILLALSEWHPVDLAELLEDLNEGTERLTFFRAWEQDDALWIFNELEPETQAELLESLTQRERSWLLNAMPPDERADLFGEIEDEERIRLLTLVSSRTRQDIQHLLRYDPDTAGGIMTTAYVAIPDALTCEDGTRVLRQVAEGVETIYVVYATNFDGRLTGVLSLRDLILARATQTISEVMERKVIFARVDEDQEDVAHRLRTYDLVAIPVVDETERLVGVVTVDDVLDVIHEENTEDSLRMAAITTPDESTPYVDASPWILARQRVTWLLVLVLAGFVSGLVLERYSGIMEVMIILTFFIPVLTGSGGNAGTQVSTTIVRSLATKELSPGDVFMVLRKELAAGLIVGIVMGLLVAVRVWMMDPDPLMVITVGCTMTVVVISAILLGGMLPLFLKKIGLDPALMSSPLITTVTDSLTLLIYFEIARRLLSPS
jgi:magnesium transporter